MASNPSPSPSSEALRPIVRSARSLRSLRVRSEVGTAVRGAHRIAGDLGVAASRRRGARGQPAGDQLPVGVWPRAAEPDDLSSAIAAGLDPALARYAAAMRRRRRAQTRPRPPRTLPLVARRGATTAAGPRTGPGAIAARSRPEDVPVGPLLVRLDREAEAQARPSLPSATTTPAGPSPGPRPRTAAPTRTTTTRAPARRRR